MNEEYDVVVVGAGHAGTQLAVSLHAEGYPGTVAVLSLDSALPYERPPLSKGYLRGEQSREDIAFRPAEWWRSSVADLHLDTRVGAIDAGRRVVTTDGGVRVGYGDLVWAAGGTARPLPVPGAELAGIHTVRSLADATRLSAEVRAGARVVVVGGGFIGLETAAALVGLGAEVTVVESAPRLLARVTGPTVAEHYRQLHSRAGVRILTGRSVARLTGTDRVREIHFDDGTRRPADLVVVGIGLSPSTEVLATSGARCEGGVIVDDECRTSLDRVFAIGDCTRRRHAYGGADPVRIESVANAVGQAKIVASILVGKAAPPDSVPWFWSHQYDVMLRTAGIRRPDDVEVVRGDPESGRFSVGYLREGVLVAVDCVDRPADFAQGKVIVGQRISVDPAQLSDVSRPVKSLARTDSAVGVG